MCLLNFKSPYQSFLLDSPSLIRADSTYCKCNHVNTGRRFIILKSETIWGLYWWRDSDDCFSGPSSAVIETISVAYSASSLFFGEQRNTVCSRACYHFSSYHTSVMSAGWDWAETWSLFPALIKGLCQIFAHQLAKYWEPKLRVTSKLNARPHH